MHVLKKKLLRSARNPLLLSSGLCLYNASVDTALWKPPAIIPVVHTRFFPKLSVDSIASEAVVLKTRFNCGHSRNLLLKQNWQFPHSEAGFAIHYFIGDLKYSQYKWT